MKRTLSLILSFAFFVGTFSGVISAEAKSTSQLRSEKQKIQQQIDSAQSKLNKLSAEKKKNQEYLETLRSKIKPHTASCIKELISLHHDEINNWQDLFFTKQI